MDIEYLDSGITRNYKRSIITKIVRVVLQALPSNEAFSVSNLISIWEHIDLEPHIQLGTSEDATKFLSSILNNILLKQHRGDRDQLLTKFKGLLVCRRTRYCEEFELADFFEGQSDKTPVIHCIPITAADRDPVNIREKLSEFLSSSF